ncbi:hypothetical protein C3446_24925 [Escherichia coli]|nr:hypothetical protein C3446_24925 [Escherichia coli]
MMSLWDALRMNMMISYQELVRTFLNCFAMSGNLLGSGVGGLLGLAPYPPLFKCPYFDASPIESIY